jgi:hypothetical protein
MDSKKIVVAALLACNLAACDGGGLPASLGTPDRNEGNGPVVKFDMFAKPLPEVPLPIDIATRPDPNSPTGRRINASMVAPTNMEHNAREKIDQLDGWGVYSPITVGFTHPDAEAHPELARLDLQNIVDRHQGDDFDFVDDAVYVINMNSASPNYGKPVPLDIGEGNFPFILQEPNRYYENDPRGATSNILLETVEEDANGNGKLDPGEDTDFDGVLDHPNVMHPNPATDYGQSPDRTFEKNPDGSFRLDAQGRMIPDLISFYERQTNLLIMRPIVPLEEGTKYAVVLTRRLVGENGEAVRSPFPYFNHVDQTADLEGLGGLLLAHPEFYGDLSTSGTDGVTFAWTFTTQSVRMDIQKLIEGLEEGTGPFARLNAAFPPDAFINKLHQCNPYGGCAPGHELPANVYVIKAEYLAPILLDVAVQVFDLNPEEAEPLVNTYQYVDYFLFGWVSSPQFLDADADGWEEESWDINWKTGRGNYTPGRVNFVAMVPKPEYVDALNAANGKPAGSPSPVVFYGHGYTGFRIEGLGFGGSLAKFGLTTVTWDCVHHGVQLDPILKDVAMGIFNNEDLHAAGMALMDDRAVDMDNDVFDGPGSDAADLGPAPCGQWPCFPTMHFDVPYSGYAQEVAELPGGDVTNRPNAWLGSWDGQRWQHVLYQDDVEDSAGDFWTSYVFHTRDVVRQSALDLIRLIHVFRSFDGTRPAVFDVNGDGETEPYDFNADGRNDVAGDFDGDGDVDFGGKDNDYYVWGQSLGGIMAGVLGGTHPSITAVAPVSGGGGLGDVGVRSTQGGVKEAVILRMMGPLVVTVPASTRYSPEARNNRTACCDSAAGVCDPSVISLRFIVPQLNNTGEIEIACLNTTPGNNRAILPGDVIVLRNMRRPEEPRCALVAAESRSRVSIPSDLHDPLEIMIYDGSSATAGAYPLENAATCKLAPGVRARTIGSLAGSSSTCRADQTCPIQTFETNQAQTFEWVRWQPGEDLVSPAEGLGLRRGTPDIRRFMGLAQLVLDPGDPAVYAPYYKNSMVITTVGDMNVPTNTGISIARCAGSLRWDATSREARWGNRTPNRVLLDFGAIMGLERLNPPEWGGPGGPLFDADDLSHGTDGFAQPRPADPRITGVDAFAALRSWVPSPTSGAARTSCTETPEADGATATVECPQGTSALVLPYISAGGDHGFYVPQPSLAFDVNTYMVNMIGRYFQTQGRTIDYRMCLEDNTCDYIPPPVPVWPPAP